MAKWILTARLILDSGTERVSDETVTVTGTSPVEVYEGRVARWGLIERSIPTPSGIPQVGDATIQLADTDHRWRGLLAHQTPRRRRMELRLTEEGASLAASGLIYAGEITDVRFGPGTCEVRLRDSISALLDESLPAVIHRGNFPFLDVGTEAAFFPIINGACESRPQNPQGVIPLPHIGFDSATGDRWALAMHEIWEVAVYRELPGEAQFFPVAASEYNVTVETMEFPEYPNGVGYNCTFIDFDLEQPAGTELRADVRGLFQRSEWNGIPEVTDFEECRNPINFFLNLLLHFFVHRPGLFSGWDVASVQAALDKAEVALEGDSIGETRYLCDGAITSSLTIRELLARFLTSFQLDFCCDRQGRKRLVFLAESDSLTATFKEGHIVVRNSFFEDIAKPAINRSKYRHDVNYATGEWAAQPIFDNLPDQYALGEGVVDSLGAPELDSLGEPVRIPRLEEDVCDLWFVRDPFTAVHVAARRMSFFALGSYRQTWQMPLPEVYGAAIPLLELAEIVGLTHSAGAEVGGYFSREVKVVGISLDLGRMILTVRSILRVPQTIVPPTILPFVFDAGIIEGDLDSVLTGTGVVVP